MWLVKNKTSYVAGGGWVQDKDANKIWLVAVKATFQVNGDGNCLLSEKQIPVLRAGQPVGEPGKSSLLYDADLAGLKVCTDFLVHGSAWVPEGGRAPYVDVQIMAGPIVKRLRVFGDRRWERGVAGQIKASRPQYFGSMPIVYERAYGGWDTCLADPADHRMETRNPIGTGFALRAEHCVGQLLPNVEYADQLIGAWDDCPTPAGLSAVECHWSPRREHAGTYDERWLATRFPLWAEDFDSRYYNSAPVDQQGPGFWRGGETIDLLNLNKAGRMTFALPRIYPFFQTRFGTEHVEHRGRLCTVLVEPDVSRVVMVWQTSLVCNHRVDELDATVVTEKQIL
ncbi:MAG TPA: DUF2169 domain-containing protein [Steroidobacteraceae bacterium]